MPREIVGKGLRFSLRHGPCAHICRQCLISESRKRSALPFSGFEQLVHRFHDWTQREDLEIGIFVGPSFDYDLETLIGRGDLVPQLCDPRRAERRHHAHLGGMAAHRVDQLGALPHPRVREPTTALPRPAARPT